MGNASVWTLFHPPAGRVVDGVTATVGALGAPTTPRPEKRLFVLYINYMYV